MACLLALALAHASPAAATRIYRCVVDGLVTYADRDCGERPAPIPIDISAAGIVIAGAAGQPTGPVRVGMLPLVVHALMGRPSAIGVRLEGTTLVEDWTYRNRDGGLRVAFRHGRVSVVTMH